MPRQPLRASMPEAILRGVPQGPQAVNEPIPHD
jgi:hypothetical protein